MVLVLSRGVDEDIVFPTLDVTVRVVGIRGDTARLGIIAPRSIPAHRKEVWERILAAAAAAEPAAPCAESE